jgi:transketolase
MLVENFWENINGQGENKLQQIATRKGFGEGLVLAGKESESVVALSADLTESTQIESFKKAYPDRFFEMGVAEQNMASVASGMAAMGKVPFVTSYAMFSPGRNWEQIRTTICYNDVPVKVIGCHAGVSVGPDGGTHQALEDVALMRVIPNMVVIVPCDAIEAKKATLAIAKNNLPSYLRLFREKSPVITSEETEFVIGKANVMYEGESGTKKIGVIANGEMVYRSLLCVKELENKGVEVGVMNLHTVKPLDKEGVIAFAKKYQNILIVEEHQVAGGTGSAVLEMLAQENILGSVGFEKLKVKIAGVEDRFGQSGTKEELYREYGLDEKSILHKAMEMLNLK